MNKIIALIFLLIALWAMSGCDDDGGGNGWDPRPTAYMTAKEKIVHYQCYYCKERSGFCCEHQVPEYDQDIFNCENAVLFTEKGND